MAQATTWTTTYRVPNALASDTEESVTGTQWHQEASSQLADMLRDVAARRAVTWGVCEWITLIGLQHEDGTSYDPMPDVMVLRQPLASGRLASVRLDRVGAPLFIAEIASASTKGNDQGDKRAAYAAIGVPEYIVFDPDSTLLPEPLMAWRLLEGVYAPWRPEADGWWYSASLNVSFRPGHPLMRVRDTDGVELAPSGLVRRRARELELQLAAEQQRLAEEEGRRTALEDLLQRYRDQHGPLAPEP